MKLIAYQKAENSLEPCEAEEALAGWRDGVGSWWIRVEGYGRDDLRSWLTGLNLSPFVMNRVLKLGEVTKVISAPGALVIDFRILSEDGEDPRRHGGALCLGNLLVTFRKTPNLDPQTEADVQRGMEMIGFSPEGILCSLLLMHADRTALAQHRLLEQLLELDEKMDRDPGGVTSDEILDYKERLLRLMSVAEEQRECFESLRQSTSEVLDLSSLEGTTKLLVSIGGSTERRVDRMERRVADLRQRYDTHQAARMNYRLGVLTTLSAIFLPLTLLAGIWGMNFEFMPELKLAAAYPGALGLMAAIAGVMLWLFHRRGWFR